MVLVLVLVLKDIFQVLVLVLVLVLGGQVLVLVLVLGGQVLVNIPGVLSKMGGNYKFRVNDLKRSSKILVD